MSNAKKAPKRALAEEPTVTVDAAAALLGMLETVPITRSAKAPSRISGCGRVIRIPSASLRKMLDIDTPRTQ